jgi:NADH-quinone oxidoreductase subunit J
MNALGLVYFYACALLALGGAVAVVLSKNPIRGAMGLLLLIVSIAGLFLALHAQFLAAIQLIVYAGAIVVLFLFVIMLLGVDRSESLRDPVRSQRPIAIALGVIALLEVLFLAGRQWTTGVSTGPGIHNGAGNVQAVARAIFTDFLWPFEVLTILLVVAVVGGVVLARRSGLPPEQEYELERDDDDTTPSDLDASDPPTEVTTP